MNKHVKTVQSKDHVFRCKYCRSLRIVKKAVRRNKSGDVRIMRCKDCKRCFSTNIGFRYRRYSKELITEALFQYFSGMSTRQIADGFVARGIDVTYGAIHAWIRRYSKVVAKFMDSISPAVGDRFRADEVWVNVGGQKKYLFASMDDETRYWIALDLADSKHAYKAENLLRMTKEHAKIPDEFVTDGLNSYKVAAKTEFGGLTDHVREIHIRGRHVGKDNNNRMERLNGTIRDREKTFRGLDNMDTANFDGLRVHYNHARKHQALGSTPGEAAGISIEGPNKWKTMIQNGSLFLTETNQRV